MTAIYLRSSSTHFAPSVETVRLSWAPAPEHKVATAKIEIKDRAGKVVLSKQLQAPSLMRFVWDGEDTQAAAVIGPDGPIKQYVSPLRSPFTVEVKARVLKAARPLVPPLDLSTVLHPNLQHCPPKQEIVKRPPPPPPGTDVTATHTVKVLYREVRLRAMTWLEAYEAVSEQVGAAFPAAASDDVRMIWLQYRLNELGYPAGALDVAPSSVVVRALFRYALAHPDLPKVREFKTLDGWAWEDAWETEYGDLDAILAGTKASGRALLRALKASENPRSDLVENEAALRDREQSSRIILDVDTFAINKNFAEPDACADYDAELLNPVTLPLCARVLLVSARDKTATGRGVAAPKAVGAVALEWVVFDPPEDVSVVPTPVTANVPLRSQSRRYLRKVHEDIARNLDDPRDAQDNCPRTHGGAGPSANHDMTGYLKPVGKVSTSRSPDQLRFVSVACTDPSKRELGKSAVFFTGSYIAGDNYVVQARLTFAGVTDGGAIQADHQALTGLEHSFAATQRWMQGDALDPTVTQTGELTIWRRHHVACELTWGPCTLPPINWFPVIDNFRAAHVILVPPPQGPQPLGSFITDAPSKAEIARAIVEAAGIPKETKDEFDARKAQATCRTDGMYPLALRTLVDFESSPLHAAPKETEPTARFQKYARYITQQNEAWPTYTSMTDVSLAIRKAMDIAKAGPGVAILRTQYMPTPDWAALLPPDVLRATAQQRAAFKYTKAVATGMDHGVVFLDSINGNNFSDIFFVTHEISHCLFGSHVHEPTSAADHDASDRNCIMYYNTSNDGLQHGWGVRSLPSEHRVTLTLRKGAVAAPNVNAYGKIEARGFERKDPKSYEFVGSVPALQEALRGLKFKPSSDLADDYTIELLLGGDGVHPVLAPQRLPVSKVVAAGDGTVKPFPDVTVTPVEKTEPRFCGKCLLKLRGWRVRDLPQGQRHGLGKLATSSPVVPVNPTMHFLGYVMKSGIYVSNASGVDVPVTLDEGTTDPLDSRIALGPFAFLHKHRLTWEASNGRMASLAGVRTREWVRFRGPTQASPFTVFADPDQEFTQEGSEAKFGSAEDDHSIGWPALVVASPLRAGSLVGEQWYQYSLDGVAWLNIEGAAFLLEKRVHFSHGRWLLTFKKTNWAPHNPKPFSFEISYIIGTAPASRPKVIANAQRGTPQAPYRSGGAIVTQPGATCAVRNPGGPTPVTLDELQRKGYVPS